MSRNSERFFNGEYVRCDNCGGLLLPWVDNIDDKDDVSPLPDRPIDRRYVIGNGCLGFPGYTIPPSWRRDGAEEPAPTDRICALPEHILAAAQESLKEERENQQLESEFFER